MRNNSKKPIGIFDSGIGGTSIWKEINVLLPNENTIYLSDSKNAPYGLKSKEKITELSLKNSEFLLEKNCKLIVVACNTATTNSIDYLREKYDVPFIGIEPAIKPASLQTKTKTIGILATKGTLNSTLFEKTSSLINRKNTVIEQVGEGLVELIEDGEKDSMAMYKLLNKYIKPMLVKNVDCLVLGCTHYSYLIPQIRKIVGNKMQIIDSGEAVARQTKNILTKNNLLNTSKKAPKNQFYINTKKRVLKDILNNYPSIKIDVVDF